MKAFKINSNINVIKKLRKKKNRSKNLWKILEVIIEMKATMF